MIGRRITAYYYAAATLLCCALSYSKAFVLPKTATIPSSSKTRLHAASTLSSSSASSSSLIKNPIIIFPAQFGIRSDYDELIQELNSRGHPAIALDLQRFDWLKITKSIPTADYWAGTLQPKGSLDFYFEAASRAVDEVKAQYPNKKIHLVVSHRCSQSSSS